jgi:integrase
MSRKATGIEVRHQRGCAANHGRRCTCKPKYRAEAFSVVEDRRIRRTFQSLAEAKAWRTDAQTALRQGTLSAARSPLLGDAAAAWLVGAEAGSIRNRSGDVYKPSAIRGYEQALRLRVLPALGALRVNEIRRGEVQALIDRLLSAGHNPSTIRNTLLPLRAIFRRALTRGAIAVNPTVGLELPAVRGRRDRIATPDEAAALLGALDRDRALWATAMYAGLRLGELMALDWQHVDLDDDVIRVRWSYDQRECKRVAPKSRAGVRTVPIPGVLRTYLSEHRLPTGRPRGFVFGRDPERPFAPQAIYDRADRSWSTVGLQRIRPHECRHTFASFMIAAGVNAKALSIYMGHSSVTITFDRYGHLMPGNEAEAASLLDAYLGPSRRAG